MRPSAFHILTLATAVWLSPVWGAAQSTGISAKLHPWGLFNPGAWKTARVVTEALNEQGQVVSTCITDTKTTLVDIDNDGVTLEIQACIEMAGKRIEAEPQIVKQGFHGEFLAANLKLKEPVDAEVVIEGKKIPCKSQQLEIAAPNGNTVITIYYSTEVAPYLLKRESVTTNPENKNVQNETTTEVIALNMPVRVQGKTKNGSYVKTVHKSANGAVSIMATVLPEAPGGVVGNSSREVDKSGRLVRRSTLELIDFGNDPDKDRTGIFGRKRSARHRGKSPSHFDP